MNVVKAATTALEFYRALGIERLPVELPKPLKLQKEEALNRLLSEIEKCNKCRLSAGRKNIVFGEGSPNARIMFIGEAPGREEDLKGRPFVGEAGQLLTKLINRMGEEFGKETGGEPCFGRKDVYIGNIVKCRPPDNRDPNDDEIKACMPYIKKQIEIISPEVIISLGRISAHTLTGASIPISRLRGRFFDIDGIPLMPTFHPAYLLRNPKDKILVWEDALKVIERLREAHP